MKKSFEKPKFEEGPQKEIIQEPYKSFWEQYHKEILKVARDPKKENIEKAKEIAEMRLKYLSYLLEHPISMPREARKRFPVLKTHPLARGISFYHHQSHAVRDIIRWGILTPASFRPEKFGAPTKAEIKKAEKIRKMTGKEELISPWPWDKPYTSLLPDKTVPWDFGFKLLIDPNYLYEIYPNFYKKMDSSHRGTSDVPFEAFFYERIPPRALLAIYHRQEKVGEMNEIISLGLKTRSQIEKVPENTRNEVEDIIQFFQKNPEKALPIFSDVDLGKRRYNHFLEREEVELQPTIVWP